MATTTMNANEMVASIKPRKYTDGFGKERETLDYAFLTNGRFMVRLIPAQQRTRAMKAHHRVEYNIDGKRVSQQHFETELQATEAAVEILAQACQDCSDVDLVGSLLDAIYYLRSGRYPSMGRRGTL